MAHMHASMLPEGSVVATGTGSACPLSASDARSAVERLLGTRCGASLRETAVIDALLATSELVTNAIRHAGGVTGFVAHLTSDGRGLELGVSDASDQEPVTGGPPEPGTPGGFGWPMILRICQAVRVHREPGRVGKTIVVRLALH
ncbi:ATP-binding protein [Streptomyces sp. NPDC047108]|uniref:ATP-binding protein n=1 Tax=Streptomyces sp. NPDC047108 TaxID=3155025 RepID=UPI0033D28394